MHQVTHGTSIDARTTDGGAQLEVSIDGTAVEESPVALKEGDLFLPHTLLVLLDAIRKGDGDRTRTVEIDFDDGFPAVHWSPRRGVRPLVQTDELLLKPAHLLRLAGQGATEIVVLPGSEETRVPRHHRRSPPVLLVSQDDSRATAATAMALGISMPVLLDAPAYELSCTIGLAGVPV